MKSATCVSRRTGKPLTEYATEKAARQGAKRAKERFGRRLVPYRCADCGNWHLAPENRHTPSSPCPVCRGADGKPKEAYRNEAAAQRRAAILQAEQGVGLRVYPCEYGHGWHLTSRTEARP